MSMYVENGWTDRETVRHRVLTLELDLLYIKESLM